ncbi:hypothetical protein DSECCO2_577030 [anaerobic digester metagenome]
MAPPGMNNGPVTTCTSGTIIGFVATPRDDTTAINIKLKTEKLFKNVFSFITTSN